jgi:deazaflavin-dependent oxidoreductase (nitroreductase family)
VTIPDDPVAAGADAIGEELAAWGRVLLLETRCRRTGARRVAAVGFVTQPDGSMLVAAGGPDTDWARNLAADARCRISIGEVTCECRAEPLPADEAARAVVALILRYGTPAEGLGSGAAFRLVPIPTVAADPA